MVRVLIGSAMFCTAFNGVAASLTSVQKAALLDEHHRLRKEISTPCTAADMMTMTWDDTLASEAQTYAEACVAEHASGAGSAFGENLYMRFPDTKFDTAWLTASVASWYDEINDVEWVSSDDGLTWTEAKSRTPSDVSTCSGPDAANGNCMIGHFTQVVWGKSNKLGCGVAACTSSFTVGGSDRGSGVFMVCRYSPSGNGAPPHASANHFVMPFTPGKQCAMCPDNCVDGQCTVGVEPNRCRDESLSCESNLKTLLKFGIGEKEACEDHLKKIGCNITCGVCTAAPNLGKAHCGTAGSQNSGDRNTDASSSKVGSFATIRTHSMRSLRSDA